MTIQRSPAGKQGQQKERANIARRTLPCDVIILFSSTRDKSYAATYDLRQTEKRMLLKWMREHPNTHPCRQQLVDLIKLPINHVTRAVYDLMGDGLIIVSHIGISPVSGRKVEFLKLSE